MKKVLIVLCLFLSQISFGQVGDVKIPKSKKKLYAEILRSMELQDYFLARRYFDAMLEKGGLESSDQKFQYAKLLYKLGDERQSLDTLKMLNAEKYKNELLPFYTSIMLNSAGSYKESKDYCLFFLKQKGCRDLYPKEHSFMSTLKLYLDTVKASNKDSLTSSVYPIEGKVNGTSADFCPQITSEGLLHGTQNLSTIHYYKSSESEKFKHQATRSINFALGKNDKFPESNPFPLEIQNMELSSFCYNLDKRVIYLSGCIYREELKRYKCDIYQSKLIEGQWTNPEIIKELYNEEASNTHVNIGYDAIRKAPMIFFASDRPDGRGGLDLYMSFYNTRTLTFSTPRSLGGRINTTKDDMTPYYHLPTNTLYFSSNGRGGKGGHDIYYSSIKDGLFLEVSTLGAEINSPHDDVFFTPSKTMQDGYLVSNRYSENSLINPHCCDDIFYWEMSGKKRIKMGKLKVEVYNKKTGEMIPKFNYQLFKIDSNGANFVDNGKANDSLRLNDLNIKTKYEVEVAVDKFYRKKQVVDIKNDSLVYIKFYVEPIDFNPIILPLVEFEFDSFVLTDTSRYIIDSLVVPVLAQNPTLKIELSAHTDSRGTDEYNEVLSQKRAAAIRFYLINRHNVIPERLTSKGYGEYVPIAQNENADGTDNPEGRQRNRRCEFRILQETYDPY
jgi:OmpA-OmpF porin, OOP family